MMNSIRRWIQSTRFKQATLTILATLVLVSSIVPPGVLRAEGPGEEPLRVSPELHGQVLDLRQQLGDIAPYLEATRPKGEAGLPAVAPAASGPDGLSLPDDFEPRAGVDFTPPPVFSAPDLAPVGAEALGALGLPDVPPDQLVAPADLSDPFNPINSTASYSLLSGHTAQDFGWALASGLGPNNRITPRVCYDCSASHYYQPFKRSRNSGTPATILNRLSKTQIRNALLKIFGAPAAGNGNQMTGRLPHPGGWNVNSRDPFFAGAGNTMSNSSFSLLALLGYDRDQIYAYRTLLQKTLSSLYTPWRRRARVGGFRLGLQAASTGAGPTATATSLEARYLSLAEQQLALYHQDANLSNLRTEAHRVYLLFMYYDPYYLYLDYALNAYLQSIYTSRPSYPALYNQARLVRSRTSPPSDYPTLRQHYYDRLLLYYYKSLVEYETAWYLYVTPSARETVRAYTAAMSNRLAQLWSTQQISDWYAGWTNRWLNSYQASPDFSALDQGLRTLHRDYPALEEYAHLNQDVIRLLPAFENLPSVEAATDQLDSALTSQKVADQVSQQYNTYTNQVNSILYQTNYAPRVERYNQQLNGLFANDPTYQQVAQLEHDTLLLLLQFQESVYLAVLECYNTLGSACDPTTYWKVQQIYSQKTSDGTPLATALVNVTGSFYEVYNLFWYQFFHSSDYADLEQSTAQGLEAEISPISTQIEQAQAQFRASVRNIPEVSELQARIDSAAAVMLGQSPASGLSAAESAELRQASSELQQKLERMAQLALILEGEQAYLPLIIR